MKIAAAIEKQSKYPSTTMTGTVCDSSQEIINYLPDLSQLIEIRGNQIVMIVPEWEWHNSFVTRGRAHVEISDWLKHDTRNCSDCDGATLCTGLG
jgi:hypothetical protein